MAEGLIELRETDGVDIASEKGIQYFLDRFYINRISIRMLQNQHLVVFGNVLPESPRHVGCIDPACDVEGVVHDAFENARFLCDRYYLTSPSMKLEMHNAVEKDKPITIVAVPSHLYHIMFELLKNAMRATVEHHGVDDDLPDIKVFVVRGQADLSIKICDRGGGVSRTIVERLFNYMYSTAPPPPRDGTQAPLAGYGYGLPLSRLYARYFLGDLFLVSMEGYGTDACVYMKNAMRATVEHHGVDDDLPDIKVFVVRGQADLSIKICDRGGGVSRTIVERLFNYMYSTAPPPPRDGTQAPLAGYGYGLPLSRLYARYFLGDLFLVSMEGYGTDACVYMKAVPVEASEVLPIYSTSSRRNLTMGPQVADWSHNVTGHSFRPG
ncbi:ATPase/histidine kinase/DNA gyrase B/HSP90 domain protein [Teladorsagia circumcincta]|uniref:Protein-serine/threonine kinase n=1 Tax=Teladorsagia circumcincta TaxID=45464 RepID=A0A2G9UIW6_TELCI|nr:ATPase/histidine kinase/DNA gyrase B/HSP90 domain protein [Teladorsagia circumcincta]